jgi:hypothetical protein
MWIPPCCSYDYCKWDCICGVTCMLGGGMVVIGHIGLCPPALGDGDLRGILLDAYGIPTIG